MTKPKQKRLTEQPDALFGRVVSILEQAQSNVVRAVNSNMVLAYWSIGREIVQELQGGEERAEYGKQVLETLSGRLAERYGKGYSVTNLKYFRLFFQAYTNRMAIRHPAGDESAALPILHMPGGELPTLPIEDEISRPAGVQLPQGFSPQLSWSHYRALMRVTNVDARDFYEREASECGWSKMQLAACRT